MCYCTAVRSLFPALSPREIRRQKNLSSPKHWHIDFAVFFGSICVTSGFNFFTMNYYATHANLDLHDVNDVAGRWWNFPHSRPGASVRSSCWHSTSDCPGEHAVQSGTQEVKVGPVLLSWAYQARNYILPCFWRCFARPLRPLQV